MTTKKSFDHNLVKTRTAASVAPDAIVLCGETLIITPAFAQPSNTRSDVTLFSEFCQATLKGRRQKKNWDESVRLTDWVDPPPPSHESVRKM